MKKYLSISIASILTLIAPSITKAQLYFTAAVGGVPTASGATLENFNEPTQPSILTFSGNAGIVTGTGGGRFAAPYFSGSTAAFFGESPTTGPDSTKYVGVYGGVGDSARFSFQTPQNYFGLFWGSTDADNSLTFYDSANNVIGTVSGADVRGLGLNDPNAAYYVNITSTIAFSSVVAACPVNSFEFDDIAYAMVVPEPASSVLFGCGLCILGLALRRKLA